MTARIDTFTRGIIFALQHILDAAANKNPEDTPEDLEEKGPPSLSSTADAQLKIDTATMDIVRVAEEFMILSRTMKELWLLGKLDTLVDPDDTVENARVEQLTTDEDYVVRGLQEWFSKNGHRFADLPVNEEVHDDSMVDG